MQYTLGDGRDLWWNRDFLAFLGDRWALGSRQTLLDVGCGLGHWSRLLASAMSRTVSVAGVDRDPQFVAQARQKAIADGRDDRFSYQVAEAEALPFPDDSFDVVTCQTVLMHVRDPMQVVREMARVACPGGLVVVTEATNLVGPFLRESVALGDAPDLAADLVQFQLRCQRGRASLGEGDELIGETLPGLFEGAGLLDVDVRMNDRVIPLLPPYGSAVEQAIAEDMAESARREMWQWDRATSLRFFIAGGGRPERFDDLWSAVVDQKRRLAQALDSRRYTGARGRLCYIVCGRKAGASPSRPRPVKRAPGTAARDDV
jgi:SAM-dependent methyltransferase